MSLPDLLGAFDPLILEVRRHADVGHDHPGHQLVGSVHELVKIRSDADHRDVVLQTEQGTNALADDEVVVRKHDCDGVVADRSSVIGYGRVHTDI